MNGCFIEMFKISTHFHFVTYCLRLLSSWDHDMAKLVKSLRKVSLRWDMTLILPTDRTFLLKILFTFALQVY